MNYTLRLPVNVLFGFLEVGMKPLHNKRVGRRMEVIRNDMRVKMDAGLVEKGAAALSRGEQKLTGLRKGSPEPYQYELRSATQRPATTRPTRHAR